MTSSLTRIAVAGLTAASLILGAPTLTVAQTAPVRAGGEHPADASARFEPVRAVIAQVLEQARVPSIAVAVVQDGRIVWEEAFGWADVERQIPATAHTPYSLASMTKPVTATAVMRLHEAGALDIDAPIETYIGGLRLTGNGFDTRAVTARRIMAHSAGLPQYGNFYLDGAAEAPVYADSGFRADNDVLLLQEGTAPYSILRAMLGQDGLLPYEAPPLIDRDKLRDLPVQPETAAALDNRRRRQTNLIEHMQVAERTPVINVHPHQVGLLDNVLLQ